MMHTFSIIQAIVATNNLINSLLQIMEVEPEIAVHFSTDFDPSDTSTHSYYYYPKVPGVNCVKLTRSTRKDKFYSAAQYMNITGFDAPADTIFDEYKGAYLPCYYAFSIQLEINPYKVTHPQEKHTIELFTPIKTNVEALEEAFPTMINSIFQGIDCYHLNLLANFRNWNMRRIDYSFNLHFEDDSIRAIFHKMIHKTSKHIRTTPVKVKKQKRYEQSAAERNKSYKVICYDKQKEVEEQDHLTSDDKRTLLASAHGIQRYEVQIGYNGIASVMKRYGLPDRSAYRFLSLDIAYHELIGYYTKTIGVENFYNRHEAVAIIRKNYKEAMATKLIDILQLIAQARGVDKAKKQFTSGGYHPIKISNKTISGSSSTFNSYLKKLKSVGINPVLIADVDKLVRLINPVYQIHDAYNSLRNAQ